MGDRVVEGLTRVADRLEDVWHVRVEEVPGWESRGQGTLVPRGYVRHHTASPTGSGRHASLRVVTYGRAGLRGALCNTYTPRGPGREAWLVAAGLAWHAGRGGWSGLSGNGSVFGGEYEHDGRDERWHPDALYAQLAIEVECAREFGFDPPMGCDHKEWAPTRKVDRAGVDPGAWRQDVADQLARETEEDTVIFISMSTTNVVWLVTGGVRVRFSVAKQADEIDPHWRSKVRTLSAGHPLFKLPEIRA